MTWHVHITHQSYNTIVGLPDDDVRGHLFALFRDLEYDPYDPRIAKPHGEPDGIHWEAVFGGHGILVYSVNRDTGRITPYSITWAG